jgi:hypothetical protein
MAPSMSVFPDPLSDHTGHQELRLGGIDNRPDTADIALNEEEHPKPQRCVPPNLLWLAGSYIGALMPSTQQGEVGMGPILGISPWQRNTAQRPQRRPVLPRWRWDCRNISDGLMTVEGERELWHPAMGCSEREC